MISRRLVTFGLIAAPLPASAHSYRVGALSIGHAWMLPSAGPATQGFVPLSLGSGPADALLRVETELASSVTLRRGENVLDRIDLPAGRGVPMRPGALHLAFAGISRPLRAGEKVPVVLVFERAGRVSVDFWVETAPYGGGPPRP
jgi:periplasmic copper chaperone A